MQLRCVVRWYVANTARSQGCPEAAAACGCVQVQTMELLLCGQRVHAVDGN